MAIQSDKLDFSQPDNTLSKVAEEQRKKLFPRNDFKHIFNTAIPFYFGW